jgi:serine/threonine protein kinase
MEKYNFVSELGIPLFTSRSSQIFLLEDNVLLKLFNNNISTDQVDVEVVNTTEAFAKGVTQVKCYGKCQIEDRYGIIMERVSGKTLLNVFTKNPLIYFKTPKIMAELQLQLHRTKTYILRDYKDLALSCLNSGALGFLTEAEKQIVKEYIAGLPDGNSILHLDYHPDNIMCNGKNVTIIDWMTAAKGVPAADMATTTYLLNEGEMIPGLPRLLSFALEKIRKNIFKSYFKIYKKATGITDEEISKWRIVALIVRLSVWNIESEIGGHQASDKLV